MAEKISMLIVKVDLDCHKCYDKMRKILCKLQDQERIRTISFDDKSKTIVIAGPFDPQRLACKIRCRGGKTVKDIQIIDVSAAAAGGGMPPPPEMVEAPPPQQASVNNGGKKKHKQKPPAAEPPPPQPPPPEPAPAPPPDMPPPSSPPHQPATPDRGMASTMPAFHEEDRPMPQPAQLEPPPPQSPRGNPPPPPADYYMPPPPATKPRASTPPPPQLPYPKPEPYPPADCVIPTVEIPSWPAAPVGPCGCPCCAPCYQGYFEGCRCGCGGARVYGCAAYGPPAAAWCAPRGCRIINEEDPNAACSIM